MQWCITPADVSALKQAIGPIVFGCAASGVLAAFAVIVVVSWWSSEGLKKRERAAIHEMTDKGIIALHRMEHRELMARGANLYGALEWMANHNGRFGKQADGLWFVECYDAKRDMEVRGPAGRDVFEAVDMAADYVGDSWRVRG